MGYNNTKLTEADRSEIRRLRFIEQWSYNQLVDKFKVTPRTLNRICGIPRQPRQQALFTELPEGFAETYDIVQRFKTRYGFNLLRPLFWGRYNTIDQVMPAVTDGIILWTCDRMLSYAEQLAAFNLDPEHLFNTTPCEISTFELSKLMNSPIGGPLKFAGDGLDGVIRLSGSDGEFEIADKFYEIVKRDGFSFYAVESSDAFIFIVQETPNMWDFAEGIRGCVATMHRKSV